VTLFYCKAANNDQDTLSELELEAQRGTLSELEVQEMCPSLCGLFTFVPNMNLSTTKLTVRGCFCVYATCRAEGDRNMDLGLKKRESNPKFNRGPKVGHLPKMIESQNHESPSKENKSQKGLTIQYCQQEAQRTIIRPGFSPFHN
jgi:hypothetical protein